MLEFVDSVLNRITMYRLMLYYLLILLGVAAVLGFFGLVPYAPAALVFSTAMLIAVSWIANQIFAKVFRADTNVESVYITALILALIISPPALTDVAGIAFLVWAGVWSMASKYMFAIGKKHIFNPAAFAVALTSFTIGGSASWWVSASLYLFPLVFIGGVMIVRKLKRFDLVASFIFFALGSVVLMSAQSPMTVIWQTYMHSALFFLAFVMLTEPLTMPPTRITRILYGALAGVLFAPSIHIGPIYSTPELALLVANVFAFLVNPSGRYRLLFTRVEEAGRGVYNFAFKPDRPLSFKAGQYLEWTLPHAHSDTRGNRRYFTIASSPTDREVHLGVKFYEPASSFKSALARMKPGDALSVSQLEGEFTLPRDKEQKLVFIGGGIGITPFRSMVRHLLDEKDARPVTLLYSNKTADEISYKEDFDRAARELGMKVVYALTAEKEPVPGTHAGPIDASLIAREVPDYRERTFYISGPHSMVGAFEKLLYNMGVPERRIRVDYFPGFA